MGITMDEAKEGELNLHFEMFIPDLEMRPMTGEELTRYLGYCIPW